MEVQLVHTTGSPSRHDSDSESRYDRLCQPYYKKPSSDLALQRKQTRRCKKQMSERQRRKRMNDCMEQLGSLLYGKTTEEGLKVDKATLLKDAFERLQANKKDDYYKGYEQAKEAVTSFVNSQDAFPEDLKNRLESHLTSVLKLNLKGLGTPTKRLASSTSTTTRSPTASVSPTMRSSTPTHGTPVGSSQGTPIHGGGYRGTPSSYPIFNESSPILGISSSSPGFRTVGSRTVSAGFTMKALGESEASPEAEAMDSDSSVNQGLSHEGDEYSGGSPTAVDDDASEGGLLPSARGTSLRDFALAHLKLKAKLEREQARSNKNVAMNRNVVGLAMNKDFAGTAAHSRVNVKMERDSYALPVTMADSYGLPAALADDSSAASSFEARAKTVPVRLSSSHNLDSIPRSTSPFRPIAQPDDLSLGCSRFTPTHLSDVRRDTGVLSAEGEQMRTHEMRLHSGLGHSVADSIALTPSKRVSGGSLDKDARWSHNRDSFNSKGSVGFSKGGVDYSKEYSTPSPSPKRALSPLRYDPVSPPPSHNTISSVYKRKRALAEEARREAVMKNIRFYEDSRRDSQLIRRGPAVNEAGSHFLEDMRRDMQVKDLHALQSGLPHFAYPRLFASSTPALTTSSAAGVPKISPYVTPYAPQNPLYLDGEDGFGGREEVRFLHPGGTTTGSVHSASSAAAAAGGGVSSKDASHQSYDFSSYAPLFSHYVLRSLAATSHHPLHSSPSSSHPLRPSSSPSSSSFPSTPLISASSRHFPPSSTTTTSSSHIPTHLLHTLAEDSGYATPTPPSTRISSTFSSQSHHAKSFGNPTDYSVCRTISDEDRTPTKPITSSHSSKKTLYFPDQKRTMYSDNVCAKSSIVVGQVAHGDVAAVVDDDNASADLSLPTAEL